MTSMRFRLTSTALVLGLLPAACEKRTEPPRESERAPYQEPVREARPTTDTTTPHGTTTERNGTTTDRTAIDRTGTDKTTAERPSTDKTTERSSTAAGSAQNESAVSSITQARCDREARCNNVGGGRKYESRADCVTKTRADWRDDLNARECPNGVVSSQLASCVSQIKEESCNNPVEKLESVLACRTVDLCKRG